MQAADLTFPGLAYGSLRREVASAISDQELVISRGGTPDGDLKAFLMDAAAKCPPVVTPAPVEAE